MARDAYRWLAPAMDAVIEPANSRLRALAVRLVPASTGTSVLDVGCGTGAQLERYAAAGAVVAGVDASPAMLERARKRLGTPADLRLGDARALPFPDASFDVVTSTLVLHELTPRDREAVAFEMGRVVRRSGTILLVEFHPGPVQGLRGWLVRGGSVLAELVARHLSRSRDFLATGGVPGLADRVGLRVERTKVVAGGNLALYVLRPPLAAG